MTDTTDPDIMNLPEALSVRWRPGDSKRLTYIEREAGTDTVYDYRFDIDASERIVRFDDRISGRFGRFDWNQDGRKLTYTRTGQVRIYDTISETETTPIEIDAFVNEPRWAPASDRIAFISGRGTVGNDIWVFDSESGELVQVTEGANPHDDKRWYPAWSPTGDQIAYVSAEEWQGTDWADEVFVVKLSTGESERLTEGLTVSSVPSWGPDGDRIAFFTKRVGEPWYRHSEDLHIHDLTTGDRSVFHIEASHQYNVQSPLWSPNGEKVYYPVRERGNQQLEAIVLDDDTDARGVPTRLTDHKAVLGAGPAVLSPDGESLGFTSGSQDSPPQPATIPTGGGSSARVRDPDPPDSVQVPQNVTYESFDGLYINSYLYMPADASPENPVPALVQCHGGAHFQYGSGWHPLDQYLAANGFAVLAVDFRGSGGYGRAFQELSMQDWEGGEVKDIREAASFLRSRPETTDEVGIYGGSWGGFMTLHSIVQFPNVWDAAVEWYGVVNQFTDYEEVDRVGRLLTERDLGGTPEERSDAYHSASTHWRLNRIETPLAVLHGAQDERVPINQAEELIEALESQSNVPFEATIYEDEGHGFRARDTRCDAARTTLAWFDEHLR